MSLCRASTQLKLIIISGQHIPKANQDLQGEVVDPYVVVKIVGHPADAQKKKTDIVRNNGEMTSVSPGYVRHELCKTRGIKSRDI